MVTVYPIGIDTSVELPSISDAVTSVNAVSINKIRDAILAVERQLGVVPAGVYGTVRARLDFLEAGLISLNGDLGGTLNSQLVLGLQGRPVLNVAPATGQILTWNGVAWIPGSLSVVLPVGNLPNLAGDVTGPITSNAVSTLTGSAGIVSMVAPALTWISSAAPLLNQTQQANGSNPNNITITTQAPGAGAATVATGTPGSLVVNVTAPVASGTEAGVQIQRAGLRIANIQAITGNPTSGAIYLGLGATSPSSNNYNLSSNGTTTILNAPPSGAINLSIGNSTLLSGAASGVTAC